MGKRVQRGAGLGVSRMPGLGVLGAPPGKGKKRWFPVNHGALGS